ncbi:MAG: putative metal-binding motif-containing protein [Sandaracinaceae bacterium]|nr:putative metal-binding motif-containing protein [Sandaracinaceae bacterium]
MTNPSDCDDGDASVHPGADELCDGRDNDCSFGRSGMGIDASEDVDGDGHSPIAATCTGGFPRDDCNDGNAAIHPGAAELCDGLDNDCSSGGGTDASEDADGDGHAAVGAACTGGPLPRDDCNDADASVHPGAAELCDGIDSNCSVGGGAEPGEDADGDGHAPVGAACTGGPFPSRRLQRRQRHDPPRRGRAVRPRRQRLLERGRPEPERGRRRRWPRAYGRRMYRRPAAEGRLQRRRRHGAPRSDGGSAIASIRTVRAEEASTRRRTPMATRTRRSGRPVWAASRATTATT